MKSREVTCHPQSFTIYKEASIRILVHFQDHLFSMISGGFLVLSSGESTFVSCDQISFQNSVSHTPEVVCFGNVSASGHEGGSCD